LLDAQEIRKKNY